LPSPPSPCRVLLCTIQPLRQRNREKPDESGIALPLQVDYRLSRAQAQVGETSPQMP
jgi:hypothetical protein